MRQKTKNRQNAVGRDPTCAVGNAPAACPELNEHVMQNVHRCVRQLKASQVVIFFYFLSKFPFEFYVNSQTSRFWVRGHKTAFLGKTTL